MKRPKWFDKKIGYGLKNPKKNTTTRTQKRKIGYLYFHSYIRLQKQGLVFKYFK